MTSDPITIGLQTKNLRESRALALQALLVTDPVEKVAAVRRIDPALPLAAEVIYQPDGVVPGRPAAPELVSPTQLKHRGVQSPEGRAVLLHALAHIEFNAINLALDIVWRFEGLPEQFYRDWLQVAHEEALHFELLCEHLASFDHRYGDFPAHDGLWEMAVKTSGDLMGRLAMVPRTLEARGLDASPPIRNKLHQAGDLKAAQILDVILRDEIGHVAIGNRWYHWCCQQRGVDSQQAERLLQQQYAAPALRGPFNLQARRAAGFNEAELAQLQARQPV
jgi:uncharacterized ferritin-like protein (DUF455 family)